MLSRLKLSVLLLILLTILLSMVWEQKTSPYINLYNTRLTEFQLEQQLLIKTIEDQKEISEANIRSIKVQIEKTRLKLKAIDFWLRYLEPATYKKINGPLPVEWETEVFEKYEKPYKRPGAGLTLAELYLNESFPHKDSLLKLLYQSDEAIKIFRSDSVTQPLGHYDHFFFTNRLFLLNLAAIYTSGFECPEPSNIIAELQTMLANTNEIYVAYNKSFPKQPISDSYLQLFSSMQSFVALQSKDLNRFDHFHFIKDYVNPLYIINQHFISSYLPVSKSYCDYSLNNENTSIFDKNLYNGQNRKGIFIAVNDKSKLDEIKSIGKLLFFDPILSGNGKRSCASCHKPTEYFTDTLNATGLAFNEAGRLPRNTPTLLNVIYNHLLMLDGKHTSLTNQAKDVLTNPKEMGSDQQKILDNVLSCEVYKKAFVKFKKLTPHYSDITIDHIVSAITLYYSDFSDFNAPFDRAMNGKENIPPEAVRGFTIFMSKAKCATCHFVPQFNGVKPPYVGSEFEVIGVPSDTTFKNVSSDSGRYNLNPAFETFHAFRTGSIRNSAYTKPYMHNGIFNNMDQVIDFYDAGGGAGKGLKIDNQTLSSDSLHLTREEKSALKAFIKTLDENIIFPEPPASLPSTKLEAYKNRIVGGEY